MQNNLTIVYTAEDIQRYIDGTMTDAEMHALEKAALDDEFLADAIEGYSSVNKKQAKDELTALKNKFKLQPQKNTPVVHLPKKQNNWYKIAAAVALLAIVAVAIKLINNPTPENTTELAKNEIKATTDSINPTIIENTTSTQNNIEANSSKIENEKVTLADNNLRQKRTTNTPEKTNGGTVDEAARINKYDNQQTIAAAPSMAEASVKDIAAGRVDDNDALKEVVVTKAETKQKLLKQNFTIATQIVSADNSPIPFANVTVKEQGVKTYSDVNGNIRFPSADSVVTVVVKSVGYLPKIYNLSAKNNVSKIFLTEEKIAAANEVVIARKKSTAPSRKATFLKDTIMYVEPKDGWANYGKYISNNVELPDEFLTDKAQRPEMEVTFTVTASGNITDIQIDKTNCNNCDENTVKKAIQNGPQWKNLQGKPGKAKIKVQF